jgi:hypothetical protein
VNRTAEAMLFVKRDQACALGSEVRVVVGAVEQVADAILYGNGSKKATHTLKLIST